MNDLTKFDLIKNVPPIQEKLSEGLKTIAMSNYSNPLEAITEIIDNSVDERDSNNPPLILQITINDNQLTIFDSKSLGMGYSELSDFLNWGYSVKRNQTGKIGRYGAGGKGAIGYLGLGCVIRTKRKGEEVVWELSESNWRGADLKTFNLKPIKNYVSVGIGFTQIDISKVDKKINKEELRRMLGHIYKPLLEKGLISIMINKLKVEPFVIPLDEREPITKIREHTEYGFISGWFGKLAPKTGMRGGIRCYSNGRLITRDYKRIQEFFGHPDPQYVASMNYLIGEVYLDFIPVLPNKTDFNKGSEEWTIVEGLMHDQLTPMVEQLKSRKEEMEVTKEDVKNLPEVEKLVKLAIANYGRNTPKGNGISNGTDEGRKPSEPKGQDLEPTTRITPEQQQVKTPKTPPPPDAIGKLIRRHGFPKFDVRVGDGLSRVKLIEEEGMKVVVIDKAFSEYSLRRGDTLYKTEAAVMQFAKPLSEDEIISPDQYIQVVDDLMREVVSLYNSRKINLQDRDLETIIP